MAGHRTFLGPPRNQDERRRCLATTAKRQDEVILLERAADERSHSTPIAHVMDWPGEASSGRCAEGVAYS